MIKNYKIYLAGPLFSRGEIRDRKDDYNKIKARFLYLGYKEPYIFNPINYNHEISNVEDFDEINFFIKDTSEIDKCNTMIADIDNMDVGTIAEIGYFVGSNKKSLLLGNKKLFIIYSNWKQDPNIYKSLNKYLAGMIVKYGIMKNSIEEVLELF